METTIKAEEGIILVTGSNGRIGGAVVRRFAGRFSDVVVRAEGSSEWTLPMPRDVSLLSRSAQRPIMEMRSTNG